MPAISTGLRLCVEHRGGLARRLLDLARVGFVKVQMAVPFDQFVGHLDLAVDHVAMDLDVAGALLGPYRAHHVVQFMRGACADRSAPREAQVTSW